MFSACGWPPPHNFYCETSKWPIEIQNGNHLKLFQHFKINVFEILDQISLGVNISHGFASQQDVIKRNIAFAAPSVDLSRSAIAHGKLFTRLKWSTDADAPIFRMKNFCEELVGSKIDTTALLTSVSFRGICL